MFNFSIDSRDLHSNQIDEDLSVNDIESYYEFVAEAVMGFENALEEHDEHDQEAGGAFEFKKVYFQLTIIEFKFEMVQSDSNFHPDIFTDSVQLGFPTKIPHPPMRA